MNKRSFGGIDLLRFFAACLVVLYHHAFWTWAYPSGLAGRVALVDPQPWLGGSFASGWIGVEIFFVISGFVISLSATGSDTGRFFWARFKRLAPAVWVCAPISALVLYACLDRPLISTVKELISTLIFNPMGPWVDGVYWTLGIEIVFYGLVLSLLYFRKIHRIETAAYALALLSAGYWVAWAALDFELGYHVNRLMQLTLLPHGCFFAAGIFIYTTCDRGASKWRLLALVLCIFAAAIEISHGAAGITPMTGFKVSVTEPLLIFYLAMAFLLLSLRFDMHIPFARPLGLMTYPLYLIHQVFGAYIIRILSGAGFSYGSALSASLVLTLFLASFLALSVEPLGRDLLDRGRAIVNRRRVNA